MGVKRMTDEKKKVVFQQIEEHLLKDETPSLYLKELAKEPIFKEAPFAMLYRMEQTEQSPEHHSEGNVWIHTCMVVDEAAKVKEQSSDRRVFMWAAFLHDLGKPDTTRVRKGKITAYNHDQVGTTLAKKFLEFFGEEDEFITKVCALIKYHMHILYVVKDLSFGNPGMLKTETDPKEVALLGWCDRMGRGGADPLQEKKNIELFYSKMKAL